ncbi:MAG: penicillin-binding protein [Candidatus Dojkabacteria bacterium]|jgi:membrane peptidoglycan carboxypeptidase|nr:penicillin-binding protein [Candidatus Dojkabacteria bacterium]
MSVSKSKRRVPKRRKSSSLNSYNRIRKYNSKNLSKSKFSKRSTGSLSNRFNKTKIKKIAYIAIGIVFFLGCLALIIAGVYLKNMQNSLPSPDELVERTSDQSTKIYDREGLLLYTVYGNQNREFVPIENIPEHTKWALLAAEDIEFYQHKGLDYAGIVMSAIQNVTQGEIVRGASTITQQLVKNTILYDVLGDEIYQQTYTRKIKEILITMQVEQTFTKDEILQMYMNEIPLGGVNYGFQAAAKAYFAKDVSELTLAESALIAGLISSPGTYSPLFGTNPELAKTRQEFVLAQMLKHKNLTGVTKEEIEEAKEEELVYTSTRIDIKAPHFVFYVKQLLEEEFGVDRVERGGLKVTTSLDYSIQEIAEEEVVNGIKKNGLKYKVNNGAAMVMNPNTGEILAMVGSIDYWNTDNPKVDGNVNITTSNRQVGSSAKPYTYLAAFSRGYGPWTLAPDIRMSFGNYKPDNWDKKFEGIGTARRNLGRSRNLPSVYTLQLAGIDTLLQTTEKLGITTLRNKGDYGLALALGAGEMKLLEHTAAFGVFANEGVRNETVSILKVEDSKGNVLKESKVGDGKQVIDQKEIYLLNYILCDLGGHGDRIGTAYSRVKGSNVCFKTGTTDGPRDLTSVMYHKNIVVGVWAGNNDNTVVPGAWGVSVPLPIAHAITNRLADKYKPELFTRPAGILSTSVCKDTGAVPGEGVDCEKEATVYIAGRAPQVDNRESVTVCKANGLIPSNLTLAEKYGLLENKVLLTFKLENKLQQDAYTKFLNDGKGAYIFSQPETGVCPLPLGTDNAPVIEIDSPSNNSKYKKSASIDIKGEVRYLESISEFTISIDGNVIAGATLNNGKFAVTYSLSTLAVGEHTITVYAKDNYDKSSTKSIKFTVEEDEVSVELPIVKPGNRTNS